MTTKLIGVGKVINGRMELVTASGTGFSRPVTRKEESKEAEGKVNEEVEVSTEAEVDLVFDFVGSNKKKRGTVIHVDFPQQEEETVDKMTQVADGIIETGKKLFKPIKNYFI